MDEYKEAEGKADEITEDMNSEEEQVGEESEEEILVEACPQENEGVLFFILKAILASLFWKHLHNFFAKPSANQECNAALYLEESKQVLLLPENFYGEWATASLVACYDAAIIVITGKSKDVRVISEIPLSDQRIVEFLKKSDCVLYLPGSCNGKKKFCFMSPDANMYPLDPATAMKRSVAGHTLLESIFRNNSREHIIWKFSQLCSRPKQDLEELHVFLKHLNICPKALLICVRDSKHDPHRNLSQNYFDLLMQVLSPSQIVLVGDTPTWLSKEGYSFEVVNLTNNALRGIAQTVGQFSLMLGLRRYGVGVSFGMWSGWLHATAFLGFETYAIAGDACPVRNRNRVAKLTEKFPNLHCDDFRVLTHTIDGYEDVEISVVECVLDAIAKYEPHLCQMSNCSHPALFSCECKLLKHRRCFEHSETSFDSLCKKEDVLITAICSKFTLY